MDRPPARLAAHFVRIVAVGFFVLYALPIGLAPLPWADAFEWTIPADTDLAIYFGRCLGLLAAVVTAEMFVASFAVDGLRRSLTRIGVLAVGLVVVHGTGFVEDSQPISETAEIAMYGIVGGVSFALHRRLPRIAT